MPDETQVESETLNEDEQIALDAIDSTSADESQDLNEDLEETVDAETLKAELEKAKEYGENQRIRAEKAEKKTKAPHKELKEAGLSYRDIAALTAAQVHEDDIDEVTDYASFKKISIADALKQSVVRNTLKERAEQRATAQATHTGKARASKTSSTVESLLDKAQKTGELPDDEGLDKILEARYSR